jgi:Family of unknown function (DUF5330)
MFFLLRMAFWLGVVCVLLPGSGSKSIATADQVNTAEAVSAAGAAVSDMRGFCDRQPDACVVGTKVAVAIGHKAEAGARTLYQFISARISDHESTIGKVTPRLVTVSGPGQTTLTPADLRPTWHGPVPLPPRREARAVRPSA